MTSPSISQPPQLHFIFIPFMAPGHIIPVINMAHLLSSHGAAASIILSHFDAARFASALDRPPPIRLLKIRFPSAEAGLPPACQSADTLPSQNFLPNFSAAIKLLQHPIEQMLRDLRPTPSCLISDKLLTWTAATCRDLHLPRIVFDGMSCFTQLLTHNLHISRIDQNFAPNEPFLVPGPDAIELTRAQLPGFFNPGPNHVPGFREEVRKTETEAYGVVVNSFVELEKGYVDEFRKLRSGKVWCIGPLSLSNSNKNVQVSVSDSNRVGNIGNNPNKNVEVPVSDLDVVGNVENEDSDQCLKWLDCREPASVVYVCLGSLSSMSPSQFMELALALETSNHPFILVVRGGGGGRTSEIWKWIGDEGIEERTRERGFFVRDWAPQVAILSHPGVGAFLTHCGWNSTLEGICAGLPMITWPLFAEQFLNERLIVGVLGIGVGVGARGVVHVGGEEERENKVMREGIMEGIERVMDRGTEGNERRKRVEELAKIAKASVGEGGYSWLNVELLIQDIQNLVKNKKRVCCY